MGAERRISEDSLQIQLGIGTQMQFGTQMHLEIFVQAHFGVVTQIQFDDCNLNPSGDCHPNPQYGDCPPNPVWDCHPNPLWDCHPNSLWDCPPDTEAFPSAGLCCALQVRLDHRPVQDLWEPHGLEVHGHQEGAVPAQVLGADALGAAAAYSRGRRRGLGARPLAAAVPVTPRGSGQCCFPASPAQEPQEPSQPQIRALPAPCAVLSAPGCS